MHLQEEILEGLVVLFNNSKESGEAKYIERERQALLSFKEGSKDELGMLSLGPIITIKQIIATGMKRLFNMVQLEGLRGRKR